MNHQQILDVAKRSGVLISGRDEFLKAIAQFGKLLINKAAPRPLTKTQKAYLAELNDWQSLNIAQITNRNKQVNCRFSCIKVVLFY